MEMPTGWSGRVGPGGLSRPDDLAAVLHSKSELPGVLGGFDWLSCRQQTQIFITESQQI